MAMTTEKLREALLACESIISGQGITMAIRDINADTRVRRLSHLLWLARNGLQLVEEDRREKAMRWLGFLQGALWAFELVSVEELKNMNRPDDSTLDNERV